MSFYWCRTSLVGTLVYWCDEVLYSAQGVGGFDKITTTDCRIDNLQRGPVDGDDGADRRWHGTTIRPRRPSRPCRNSSHPRTVRCLLPSRRTPPAVAPARRPGARETAASPACRGRPLTTARRVDRPGNGQWRPTTGEGRIGTGSGRRQCERRRRGRSALDTDTPTENNWEWTAGRRRSIIKESMRTASHGVRGSNHIVTHRSTPGRPIS